MMFEDGLHIPDDLLWYSCYGGNQKIVKYLNEKGVKNLIMGFYGACYGGHIDILQILIDNYKLNVNIDKLNYGLQIACENCETDMAVFLIGKGATNINMFFKIFPRNNKYKNIINTL